MRVTAMTAAFVCLAAVSLGLTACGDDDGGSGGATEIALADYDEGYAHSICGKVFACCNASEIDGLFGMALADATACEALLAPRIAAAQPAQEAAIAAGQLRYEPAAAATCLATIDALTCAELDDRTPPAACTAVFVGLVADGEACTLEESCAAASSCREGDGGQTCVAPVGEGAACAEAPCAQGLHCGGQGEQPRCEADLAMGATCRVDSQCASNFCDDDDSTCQPRPAACAGT